VPLGWRGLRARPTNIPIDYTQFVNANGLKGARIGITRVGLNGFDSVTTPQPVLEAIEASFQALKDAGATIIDLDAQGFVFPPADGEFFVLLYDFKGDVATYFKPV
jgi:Asp-tRNA(Asn)/Glu-tRNA(Gln) amidotransferase A subunit family amidase